MKVVWHYKEMLKAFGTLAAVALGCGLVFARVELPTPLEASISGCIGLLAMLGALIRWEIFHIDCS